MGEWRHPYFAEWSTILENGWDFTHPIYGEPVIPSMYEYEWDPIDIPILQNGKAHDDCSSPVDIPPANVQSPSIYTCSPSKGNGIAKGKRGSAPDLRIEERHGATSLNGTRKDHNDSATRELACEIDTTALRGDHISGASTRRQNTRGSLQCAIHGAIFCATRSAICAGHELAGNVACIRSAVNEFAMFVEDIMPRVRDCPIGCAIHCTIHNGNMTIHTKTAYATHVGTKELWILFLAWMIISRFCPVRFKRSAKNCKKGRKEGTKESTREIRKIQRRRAIQHRIRRWNKTRKVKYDDKDRMKYRHKARASLRWIRRICKTEAREMNIKECKNRGKNTRKTNTRRKGVAGGKKRARAVDPSDVEAELIRDIGAPQYTWGDGSCWLWAVAGALHKLEGKESPTENDILLEKEWRAAIQDTVKTHGIPMTDNEFRGLGEGVQYTNGELMRGGTWGGGTEHQALAIYLKVNIIIWDRRYIGKVGAQHRQLYVCTPQARHYEYFGEEAIEEEIMDADDPEAKGIETRGRREEKEDSKIKTTTGETSRCHQTGEGK
eukprot:1047277-Pleurochrysis_carterae.AAC.1